MKPKQTILSLFDLDLPEGTLGEVLDVMRHAADWQSRGARCLVALSSETEDLYNDMGDYVDKPFNKRTVVEIVSPGSM